MRFVIVILYHVEIKINDVWPMLRTFWGKYFRVCVLAPFLAGACIRALDKDMHSKT